MEIKKKDVSINDYELRNRFDSCSGHISKILEERIKIYPFFYFKPFCLSYCYLSAALPFQ